MTMAFCEGLIMPSIVLLCLIYNEFNSLNIVYVEIKF